MAIECDVCKKAFQRTDHLRRHKEHVHANITFSCADCGKGFSRKDNLRRHSRVHENTVASGSKTNVDRRDEGAARPTSQSRETVKKLSCCHCGKSFTRKSKLRLHLHFSCPVLRRETQYTAPRREPSNRGLSPSLPSTSAAPAESPADPAFDEVETAFSCRLRTFRLKEEFMSKTSLHVLFTFILHHVTNLLNNMLDLYNAIKVNIVIECEFTNIHGETCEKNFKTMNQTILQTTDLEQLCCDLFQKLMNEKEACELRGSGWAFVKPTKFEIRINKYAPLKGEGFILLPKHLNGVVNTRNNDNFCFKYSILAKFVRGNATNPVNYTPDLEQRYDWTVLEFPVKLHDISKFEKKNNISINIFSLDEKKKVFPLKICDTILPDHRDILFVSTPGGKSHYVWISDFNKLVKHQLTKDNCQVHVCKKCFTHFPDTVNKLGMTGMERLIDHERYCLDKKPLRLDLATEKFVKFKNVERSQRVRFTIYADFETLLKPTGDERDTHEHIPYAYCYLIKDSKKEKPIIRKFIGRDAAKHFVDSIQDDALAISKTLYKERQLTPTLNPQQQALFDAATHCHICKKPFSPDEVKVRDHMHTAPYTFRGAAHQSCNLRHQEQNTINVYFHNLKYDSHFIINELAFDKQKISVIPNTEEQYISYTKYIPCPHAPKKCVKLRFVDSFRFLPTSLATLAENLPNNQFKETKKVFPDEEKFNLLVRKGVFPYSYLTDFEKLNEDKLPLKSAFYNNLTLKHVTDEEYNHAKNVWNTFQTKTLGEYAEMYLLTDVLLLTDIFEHFREASMKSHTLDPAYYITLPSYSWDAMLMTTGISLENVTDQELYQFFEKGVRGGISQCCKRLSKANNKHCKDYDSKKPSTYIQYLDATNLYGWAQSQYLPTGGFKWLSREEIDALDIKSLSDTASAGYVFEVDVHYPRKLHNLHSQLPFLCESEIPPGGKQKKLLTTLKDKKNYVVHYRVLKQAISHGLQVTNIHRVVQFDQSPWLKPYIDMNNELRKNAKNPFERDLFKLYNNSVFGKFMENVKKRMNFQLETDEKRVTKQIAKPNFLYRTIFTENLAGLHFSKTNIVLDKPMFIGMCILDISKVLMYEFFYDVLLPHYGPENVKLLYTDTDSFIIEIKTDDLFKSMLPILSHYDTSKYTPDNPAYSTANQNVLGKMKDETNGVLILEFLGIKSKLYCVILQDDKHPYIKRCKGINKPVVDIKVHAERYRACILDSEELYTINTNFRSVRHVVYTRQENKLTLNAADDKRFICPDGINTLAHGHYSITYM